LANIVLPSGSYLVTATPVSTGVAGTALLQATFNLPAVWKLYVTSFDGIDTPNDVTTPLNQAIDFVKLHSRFNFTTTVVDSKLDHSYSYYGKPPNQAVLVNKWDLDQKLIASWPSSDGYMYFWKLDGRSPAQYGSTW